MEAKVYTGVEAIERMQTHWINCAKGCWKIEGNKLLHKFYGETEVTESDMHLYFFFENKFVDYEEPLKVDDWICEDHGDLHIKVVGRILEEKPSDYVVDNDANIGVNQWCSKEFVRKATPEEIAQEKRRRVFAKVGRKVDEFKKGDVVAMSAGDLGEVLEINNVLIKCRQFDDHDQTFITFNVNHKSLKLVVPVEQRLDKEDE